MVLGRCFAACFLTAHRYDEAGTVRLPDTLFGAAFGEIGRHNTDSSWDRNAFGLFFFFSLFAWDAPEGKQMVMAMGKESGFLRLRGGSHTNTHTHIPLLMTDRAPAAVAAGDC